MTTIEQRVANHYGALLQASFGGVRFGVTDAEVVGGFHTAEEVRAGRGSVPRLIAPTQERYPVSGYLTGPTALTRRNELLRVLDAGAATLVHPWHGRVEAVCLSWSLRTRSKHLEYVALDMEFARTALPARAEAVGPASAAEATEEMSKLGAGFADEPQASAQLDTLRDALILEPPGETGSTYTEQSTRALLASEAVPAAEVPRGVQSLGAGVRQADRGELTDAQAVAIERRVLTLADRNDSLTLLLQLEAFSLFLRSGPLAVFEAGKRRTLQLIATQTESSFDELAQRNRDAIRTWFATGEVRP